jgi:hypothetical protein
MSGAQLPSSADSLAPRSRRGMAAAGGAIRSKRGGGRKRSGRKVSAPRGKAKRQRGGDNGPGKKGRTRCCRELGESGI